MGEVVWDVYAFSKRCDAGMACEMHALTLEFLPLGIPPALHDGLVLQPCDDDDDWDLLPADARVKSVVGLKDGARGSRAAHAVTRRLMPLELLMSSRNKLFNLRSAFAAGTFPALPSLRPGVSNKTDVCPRIFTVWRTDVRVHPNASGDVSASSVCAIALMTELFPEPQSPKMTTFLFGDCWVCGGAGIGAGGDSEDCCPCSGAVMAHGLEADEYKSSASWWMSSTILS